MKDKHPSHTGRTSPPRRTASSTPQPAGLAKNILKGIGVSLLCALFSLFILSAIAYFTEDPLSLIQPLGLCAAALTSFVGGFCTTRLHKHSALLCGLCNGCALLLLMLPLSLLFTGEADAYSPLVSCLLHVGVPIVSVIGAFAALPRRGRKKARRPSQRRT